MPSSSLFLFLFTLAYSVVHKCILDNHNFEILQGSTPVHMNVAKGCCWLIDQQKESENPAYISHESKDLGKLWRHNSQNTQFTF